MPKKILATNTHETNAPKEGLTVSKAITSYSSCQEKTDAATFFDKRFAIYAPNHQHVIISGSTYAKSGTKDNEEGFVLDAASGTFLKDDFGTHVGISLTTADGLGHSNREEENMSTAEVTVYGCEAFNLKVVEALQTKPNELPDTTDIYKIVGADSRQKAYNMSREQKMDSQSAMVATVAVNTEKGYQGVTTNVGDTIVVVLDGATLKVKHSLPAKVYRDITAVGNSYNPFSIQRLDEPSKQPRLETIDVQAFNCNEGDIIIQMTDGMYSSFDTKTAEGSDNGHEYHKTFLTGSDIEKLLSTSLNRKYPSAFEIGEVIAKAVFDHELKHRKNFQNILELLKEENINLPTQRGIQKDFGDAFNIPLVEWVNQIKNTELKLCITNFLIGGSHDDCHYTENTPTWTFLEDLEKKVLGVTGFGDCATLQVMRVPYQCDEILRGYLNNPNPSKKLTTHIIDHYPSVTDHINLDEMRERLIHEQYIPNSSQGLRYNNCQLTSCNQTEQINAAIKELGQITQDKQAKDILLAIEKEILEKEFKVHGILAGETIHYFDKQTNSKKTKCLPKGAWHVLNAIQDIAQGKCTYATALSNVENHLKESCAYQGHTWFNKRDPETQKLYEHLLSLTQQQHIEENVMLVPMHD